MFRPFALQVGDDRQEHPVAGFRRARIGEAFEEAARKLVCHGLERSYIL